MPKKALKATKKGSLSLSSSSLGLVAVVVSVLTALFVWFWPKEVIVVQQQAPSAPNSMFGESNGFPGFSGVLLTQQMKPPDTRSVEWVGALVKPDLYPEPVTRMRGFPSVRTRTQQAGPMQQVGILTGEGGSSNSAAPDRTILPLYGRELDPRRSKWNYYTRTDGTNPVQVPVRVGNRTCDDDRNGCNEVSSNDDVHVPALGRAFKATIYSKSF